SSFPACRSVSTAPIVPIHHGHGTAITHNQAGKPARDACVELNRFVDDFGRALVAADTARPCAANARSKAAFQPGIGPHSEAQTVKLVGAELQRFAPGTYAGRLAYGVAYPESPRQKCDLCVGAAPNWEWAVEI